MRGSYVSLKHGLVLLPCEQQECETSLVLSSPSLAFLLPSAVPSPVPPLMYWGGRAVVYSVWRVQLVTSTSVNIQCTNWDSSTTRNRSVMILLQVWNKCEQQLFIYLFSIPSFFDVGHVYFWRACCVWRRYLNFPNRDYFQKNSFLK